MGSYNDQVLLIEDDDIDAMAVERLLNKVDFHPTIVRVKNGKEALDILATPPPFFAILLDLNMPKMNGFEFLEALNKTRPNFDVCIKVLTTSDSKDDVKRCLNLGVHGYYLKDKLPETPEFIECLSELYAKTI